METPLDMKSVDNPYAPGAGTPPPELAGRDDILTQAEDAILRTRKTKVAKSVLLLRLDRIKHAGNEIRSTIKRLRGFAAAFQVKFEGVEFGMSSEPATGDLTIDLADLLVDIGMAAKSRNTVAVHVFVEVGAL